MRTGAVLAAGGAVLAACGDPTATPISATGGTLPTVGGISSPDSAATASGLTPAVPTTGVPPTLAGTSAVPTSAPPSATVDATPQPTNTSAPSDTATPKPTQSANLDLAAKVGQRIFAVLPGTSLTPDVRAFLLAVKPGGIVMFGTNITGLAQIRQFNADLQAFAAQNGLPPFIITLDEEGGIVSRLPPDARDSVAPAQMTQAAAGLDAVRDCATQTAIRLADLGFNLNLAPDADVNSNPQNPVIGTRSYGSDPKAVAAAVSAALGAYAAQGMGACVKHFPGHGDTATDSHTGLPIVNKTRADLDALELVPFKAAIAAHVPAIMSAHILFPKIEPNSLPATLSPLFLTDILRKQLGYTGLILTDSLSMGAISQTYGLAEAGRRALVAGADMVVVNTDLAAQTAMAQALRVAAQRGDFDLDASVARILAYKQTYATAHPTQKFDPAPINAAAQNGLTLLRSDGKTLPLRGGRLLLVNMALANPTGVESPQPATVLGSLWLQAFPGASFAEVSTDPTQAETQRVLNAAQQADTIVAVTRDAAGSPEQAALVKALLGTGKPIVVAAVRGAYDLTAFPAVQNYVATYSDVRGSQRALIAFLKGTAPARGKLPVALPGLYGVGAGIIG